MTRKTEYGFTFIELMLCITVAAVIIALVVSIGQYVRASSYSTICMNNLRQISMAVVNYYNDHKEYPVSLPYDTLPDQLDSYISTHQAFVCPADKYEGNDSYSQFYVYRGKEISNTQYLIGCPRHKNDKLAMNIFALGTSKNGPVAEVKVDEVKIKPGQICEGGTMALEDGTTITSSGVSMMLVQSFRMEDGRLYSIIKVPDGETGSVTADVIPGSALEIITPSSIAAVRGTTFIVNIGYENNKPVSNIGVTAGEVAVTPLKGQTMVNGALVPMGICEISLMPGQNINIYGSNNNVNTASIEDKLKSLRRKIEKSQEMGENPQNDIKLYRWLAKFINYQDLPDWYYDTQTATAPSEPQEPANPEESAAAPENPPVEQNTVNNAPSGETTNPPANPAQNPAVPPAAPPTTAQEGAAANSNANSSSSSSTSHPSSKGGGFWDWWLKIWK